MSFGNFSASGQSAPISGLHADVSAMLKRSIRTLMVNVLEDRVLHAECVAAGEFKFREVFVKDLGAAFGNDRAGCDELANVVFRFFREQWRDRYPTITPAVFLDNVEIVRPPSEEEIEAAWEIDIGSSDSAMQQMYEGSARTRKGRLETMGLKSKMEK